MYFILLLCVLSYSSITECMAEGKFRSDYTYYKEAGGWLKLHMLPANWHDARLRCQLEGAVLASPLRSGLNTSMSSIMQKKENTVYTGIHATFSKGDFFSIEGVPLSAFTTEWERVHLDNNDDAERCIIMHRNQHIADMKCTNVYNFICYKKDESKNMTQNECGTTDNEYKLSAVTGSCYKVHLTPRNWSRAYMACAAEGGHLAIINSQEEANVLSAILSAAQKNDAHIGFHDWGEHGSWLTIHGQTLNEAGYSSWGSNELKNETSAHTGLAGEYCGSMYANGKLNNMRCDHIISFICEKNPRSLAMDDQK